MVGAGSDTVIIEVVNRAPDSSRAAPSISEIWPPNHRMVDVRILGVFDPYGDPVTTTITGIRQNEPTNTVGDGNTEVDGAIVGNDAAQVRAERTSTGKVPGDGLVYHVGYSATDGFDTCGGTVTGGVPHDQGKKGSVIVDGGPINDSTLP